MNNLQRIGGIAALFEAAIYITMFVFYGAVWNFPRDASTEIKLRFLADHQAVLSIVNFTGYVIFGVFLAVLVLALHERLKSTAPRLSQLASVFGVIWVGLVIASGMIANIGLAQAIKVSTKGAEQAWSLWVTTNAVVEGLGGGNEIVGGLWVLLLSSAALKGNALPRTITYLGLLVGVSGILTVYPAVVLTEIFGLSQIVWFTWLGIFMARKSQS